MASDQRLENIRSTLTQQLAPTHLAVEDDSHNHVGHPGARHGGHYNVTIVSPKFIDKSLIERHRLVYAALSEAMRGAIHALSIKALTPEEFDKL